MCSKAQVWQPDSEIDLDLTLQPTTAATISGGRMRVGTVSLTGTCKPQDVIVEGTTAYVACYTNSSVAVVDVSNPTSPTVNGYIALPGTSYPIFLEAEGRYVYSISNTTGGMLSVIDTGGE